MSKKENLTIVGLQWGDEGKGKLVDYLAGRFDAIVRFNGGSNAGHTVAFGGRKLTFHLVPSGALKGKRLIIGAGVAVDPVVLKEELETLAKERAHSDLLVDAGCTIVSPYEKELDGFLEELRGASAIGTTRRGIGPAYAMRAFRLTPRASDLFGKFDLVSLQRFYRSFGIKADGFERWAKSSRTTLKGLLGDAGSAVTEINEEGGKVLFEGSQGTLLDLLHGSYPYVTSSHTLATYAPTSLGIGSSSQGSVLGVTKCYTTRVGGGPFPTEIAGALGARIRTEGSEYGATTGRPRRVGWLDMVALKHAVRLNGAERIAVSKVDVLSRFKEFKVCVAYRLEGSETSEFTRAMGRLEEVKPVYESPLSLKGAVFGRGLSREAKRFIDYLEHSLGVEVSMVSYGEERSNTIEL